MKSRTIVCSLCLLKRIPPYILINTPQYHVVIVNMKRLACLANDLTRCVFVRICVPNRSCILHQEIRKLRISTSVVQRIHLARKLIANRIVLVPSSQYTNKRVVIQFKSSIVIAVKRFYAAIIHVISCGTNRYFE